MTEAKNDKTLEEKKVRTREEILADKNYIHKQIEELSKKRLEILKKLK